MEKLPPIPSPAGTAFREFRIGWLPYVVFAAAIAITLSSWRGYVGPSALVGEVEMVRTLVTASQPSRIAKVNVAHLQRVAAGQPVAEVMAADPRSIESQASLSRARIEFFRTALEPRIRRQNNLINRTQLQLDWLRQRVELVTLRAQLAYFEAEADRIARLSQITNTTPFVTIQELQIAQRDLDSLRAQIQEQSHLVNEIKLSIDRLESDDHRMEDDLPSSTKATLAMEQKALEMLEHQLNPMVLVSPIDGFVSFVHRRAGETVMPGEPILTISGSRSDRIIAFIRQPLRLDLTNGMPIEVRARSFRRAGAMAQVVGVGGQMEPILPELLPIRAGGSNNVEYGLPVVVSVPPELNLIPGEIVDLFLRR